MNDNTQTLPPRRLSVAPMLDWTDRHYRYMARQLPEILGFTAKWSMPVRLFTATKTAF